MSAKRKRERAAALAAASARQPLAPGTEPPIVAFADAAAFRAWLAENHASSPGVRLKIAKEGSGHASVSYPEAVVEALVWGWIDGQKGKLDAAFWLQRFTPRSTRSIWSKINCAKAEELIAAGRMQPPGLAEVERAKRDGRWERAYESQSRATVPLELTAALAESPRAAAFFATLDSRNRYAVLFRLHTAKKPETRAASVARFVAMFEKGETIYPRAVVAR